MPEPAPAVGSRSVPRLLLKAEDGLDEGGLVVWKVERVYELKAVEVVLGLPKDDTEVDVVGVPFIVVIEPFGRPFSWPKGMVGAGGVALVAEMPKLLLKPLALPKGDA